MPFSDNTLALNIFSSQLFAIRRIECLNGRANNTPDKKIRKSCPSITKLKYCGQYKTNNTASDSLQPISYSRYKGERVSNDGLISHPSSRSAAADVWGFLVMITVLCNYYNTIDLHQVTLQDRG